MQPVCDKKNTRREPCFVAEREIRFQLQQTRNFVNVAILGGEKQFRFSIASKSIDVGHCRGSRGSRGSRGGRGGRGRCATYHKVRVRSLQQTPKTHYWHV